MPFCFLSVKMFAKITKYHISDNSTVVNAHKDTENDLRLSMFGVCPTQSVVMYCIVLLKCVFKDSLIPDMPDSAEGNKCLAIILGV